MSFYLRVPYRPYAYRFIGLRKFIFNLNLKPGLTDREQGNKIANMSAKVVFFPETIFFLHIIETKINH